MHPLSMGARARFGVVVVATLLIVASCGSESLESSEVSRSSFDINDANQTDYDRVNEEYVACIEFYVPEALVSFNPSQTYPGGELLYSYSAEQRPGAGNNTLDDVDKASSRCESETEDFYSVTLAWETWLNQSYPNAFADIEYERIADCLRENGVEIADTAPESLNAAIQTNEALYFECFEAETSRVEEANS